MDSADQTLKILIQLGVLGEKDAQAAKQLLDETSAAGKKLGESMGVITVSATEANKILEQSGEKAEISHRGFKKLAHMIGSDIPGATAMMEAGFSASAAPMMGATFLLIGGIEMLRSALSKMAEEEAASKKITETMLETAGKHSEVVEKQKAALDQAEISEAQFYHNLARNTRNAVDEAEKLAEALLKTAAASDSAHADRRKSIADSRIADMEQQGVISHKEALKMKEQLDIEYENNKMIRQMAADKIEERLLIQKIQQKSYATEAGLKNDVAEAQNNLKTAVQKQAGGTQKIAEADERIAAAKELKKALGERGATEENVNLIKNLFSDLVGKFGEKFFTQNGGQGLSKDARLDEKYQVLQNYLGYAGRAGAGFFNSLPGPLKDMFENGEVASALGKLGREGDQTLAAYEGADRDISTNTKLKKKLQTAQPGLDVAAGNAKSDLDYAQQQLQSAKNEVVKLKDQLEQLIATNNIKNAGLMQDLGLSKANAALKNDENIADRVQHGDKSVTKAEEQKLIADASKIAGHQVDLKTAAKVIEQGATNMGSFMAQLKSLAIAMGNFTPQQAADLQRQIDAIYRMLKNGGGKQVP